MKNIIDHVIHLPDGCETSNANFENYEDEQYRQLAQRIEMFIGLPMDQRKVTSLCFKDLAQDEALKDKWKYFKHIAHYTTTPSTSAGSHGGWWEHLAPRLLMNALKRW